MSDAVHRVNTRPETGADPRERPSRESSARPAQPVRRRRGLRAEVVARSFRSALRLLWVVALVAVPCQRASAQSACAADIDGNGLVGSADIAALLNGWGSAAPDLTGDGIVNAQDITALLARWGECLVPMQITGTVTRSNGQPVAGCLVQSVYQGQASTDSGGRYSLALRFPRSATVVELGALVTIDGVNYSGSVSAGPLVEGGTLEAPPIVLQGECVPQYRQRFGADPGADGTGIWATVAHDFGSGPRLVAAGNFTWIGGVETSGIAVLEPEGWRALGTGVGTFETLASIGGSLYVGGNFNWANAPSDAGGQPAVDIARWDPVAGRWTSVGGGVDGNVIEITSFDFGSGPELVIGLASDSVWRWNGAAWSRLGLGTEFSTLLALATGFVEGQPRLIGAGNWNGVAGAIDVAFWNGSAWQQFASGPTQTVQVLLSHGGEVFAGTIAGVQRWNGTTWQPFGALPTSSDDIHALALFDDGAGLKLYAGADGTWSVSRYGAAGWEWVEGSPTGATGGASVDTMTAIGSGPGGSLFVAGDIDYSYGATVSTKSIARLHSGSWKPVGAGVGGPVRSVISRMKNGNLEVFAAGDFISAGGVSANGVARWTAGEWSAIPGLTVANDGVESIAFYDMRDGQGEQLFACGQFRVPGSGSASVRSLARWNGQAWTPILVNGVSRVHALERIVDADGVARLYAGGSFTQIGGVSASRIARLDGGAWQALGGGGLSNGSVYDIEMVTVAGQASLYICGEFSSDITTGAILNDVARWNGSSWEALGLGVYNPSNTFAQALCGFGGKLYVAGNFSQARRADGSLMQVNHVAAWDGAQWSPLGGAAGSADVGLGSACYALGTVELGEGPMLLIGGGFVRTGGSAATAVPFVGIAAWNGSQWRSISASSGLSAGYKVRAIEPLPDGAPTRGVVLGGDFPGSPTLDSYLAEWSCE